MDSTYPNGLRLRARIFRIPTAMELFPAAVSLLGLALSAIPGYSQASKPAAGCSPILEIDLEMYPGTRDIKIDKVKVCEDGRLVAFHVLTAPAFGNTPPRATGGNIRDGSTKSSLADVRRFLLRADIVKMPERQDVPAWPTSTFHKRCTRRFIVTAKNRRSRYRIFRSCIVTKPPRNSAKRSTICFASLANSSGRRRLENRRQLQTADVVSCMQWPPKSKRRNTN